MTKEDNQVFQFALTTTEKAGKLLTQYYSRLKLKTQQKADDSLVTEADLKIDAFYKKAIRKKFPEHVLISEESEKIWKDAPYTWVLDPIDGTNNFSQKLPIHGISLGIYKKDILTFGFVYLPALKSMYYAIQGKGAYKNKKRIKIGSSSKLQNSLVSLAQKKYDRKELEVISKLFNEQIFFRILGSAAADLAFVAEGILDGCVQKGLNIWDQAGGILLVQEAGGTVTNFQGKPYDKNEASLIAGNSKIQSLLLNEFKL